LPLETPGSKGAEVNRVKLAGGCVGSVDGGISSGDSCQSCFCGFSGLINSIAQAVK